MTLQLTDKENIALDRESTFVLCAVGARAFLPAATPDLSTAHELPQSYQTPPTAFPSPSVGRAYPRANSPSSPNFASAPTPF